MSVMVWESDIGGVALVGFQSTYVKPHGVTSLVAVLLAMVTVSPEKVHEPLVKSVVERYVGVMSSKDGS